MRLSREEAAQIKDLLQAVIDSADAELIVLIRLNKNGSREALLSQLDVLEKVRERLNVQFDRIARQ